MSCKKSETTKKDGSVKVAEVSRNILGALNSYSLKTGKPGDFKKAQSYSLSPVTLSIYNHDGSRRHTAKSKLKDILMLDLEDHSIFKDIQLL